ncbi:MAG: PEP-CTERM sorting domain-containing protein [Nitrospinales bacterium]
MKRCLAVLCVFGFLLGFVGAASAISHTHTKTLDARLAEGPIAGIFYSSSHSYFHETPADFEVPPDKVTSATLAISGYWIDGNDDQVMVEGTAIGSVDLGTLNGGGSQGSFWTWNWDSPSLSIFNVASIFTEWALGENLGITISAAGGWGDGILELASSTFSLEYENGDLNTAVPVSEPATMLLLGSGMIGLASFGRKKFFTKVSA